MLLDTSFFIRLLNENDNLHPKALGYFKYFLEKDIVLKCSTISIAEYCVRGSFDELMNYHGGIYKLSRSTLTTVLELENSQKLSLKKRASLT